MPKLTPNKKVKLRKDLIPLVGEVNATRALKWCEDKFNELGGHVDIDVVLDLFKMQGIMPFLVNKIEEKKESLKGLISEEGATELVKAEVGLPSKYTKSIKEEYKDMKDFWDKTEDPDDFHPFLKVKSMVTYTLELIDNEAEPREGVDGFGNHQYIFDVTLRAISPTSALKDVNSDGFPLFQVGRDYAFGVKRKSRNLKRFKELWENEGPIKVFSFKRTGSTFQTDYIYTKVS